MHVNQQKINDACLTEQRKKSAERDKKLTLKSLSIQYKQHTQYINEVLAGVTDMDDIKYNFSLKEINRLNKLLINL